MRVLIALGFGLFAVLVHAHEPDNEPIRALIKKLGSPNFREREAATKSLKGRHDAASALREAIRSPDPEVVRRALQILAYFEHRPLRELDAAVKDGCINRVVELLAVWPKEKHENEAWLAVRHVTHTLIDLHEKQGGGKINLWRLDVDVPRVVISAPRIIAEPVKANEPSMFFLRAGEVDLQDSRKRGALPRPLLSTVIVASGPVRSPTTAGAVPAIFARGSVELTGDTGNMIIVSGGDVTLGCDMADSLVIARGKVKLMDGFMLRCRIISGEALVDHKKRARNCIISENDLNPLGFIRWTDAPKKKAAPESKR